MGLQHLPDDATKGHANATGGQPTAVTELALVADAENDAVAENDPDKKKRSKCPSCGHKTSKSKCSKCGATVPIYDASDAAAATDFQQGLVDHNVKKIKSKDCREL